MKCNNTLDKKNVPCNNTPQQKSFKKLEKGKATWNS